MPDGDQLLLKAMTIIACIINHLGLADLTMKYLEKRERERERERASKATHASKTHYSSIITFEDDRLHFCISSFSSEAGQSTYELK